MERALLFMGRAETPRGSEESYQLMIDQNCISTVYDGGERIPFYKHVSETFVDAIIEKGCPPEIKVFNGFRVDPKTGNEEQISKLEESLKRQFVDMICNKLRLPEPAMN